MKSLAALHADAERDVARWNAAHAIGTRVRFWTMRRGGAPSGEGVTYKAAGVMGGSAVVWIEAPHRHECIALSHVEVIDDGGTPA